MIAELLIMLIRTTLRQILESKHFSPMLLIQVFSQTKF